MLDAAKLLQQHGYKLYATGGTSRYLTENGVENTLVYWPSDADKKPQALDMLHEKQIDMVVNIPKDLTVHELSNGYKIRRAAIDLNIPLITNSRLASAFIRAFCTVKPEDIDIKPWGLILSQRDRPNSQNHIGLRPFDAMLSDGRSLFLLARLLRF